ncbi:MAG: hypothetical protein ACJ762_17335 [Solirubrobacteraceae bacterium]
MTPPAAAAAPRTRTRRATPPARRVSGPARGKQRSAAAAIASPPPLALRLGGAVHGLAEHHYLDRLVRGRAWIGILAVGLMGIVFMQVSMLRLNAGVGSAIEKTSVLERENSALRASISELSSGDRIAAEASQLGLVLPPGTPRFLNARTADAQKAASSITSPGEGIVPSMNAVDTTLSATSTTPVLSQTSIAPVADTTTATQSETPVAPATGTTDPAATTTSSTATTTDTTATTAAPTETTQPTTQQTAVAPPPADPATTGGVDASGQVG